jgi:hypothetical protein
MADETEVDGRTPDEGTEAIKGSDLPDDAKSWLSTPQSDPAQEAARKALARGIGKAFEKAADLTKQAGETKAQYETRVAEARNDAYAQFVADARETFGKRGLDWDAILDSPEATPETPGKGTSPKPGESEGDKPLTRGELEASMAKQAKEYEQRFSAQELRERDRQMEEYCKQFNAAARKYPDALNDPDSTDWHEQKALNMDMRRCLAEWGQPDASGKSPFDRKVPFETIIAEHAKSKVAAQKAIASRRKEPAPTVSRRGEATREGPGHGKPMPEKLANMDIDDPGFVKELKKHTGDIPFESAEEE